MGDYAIRMQFDIEADESVVRRAFETQEGVRSWWNTGATFDGGGLRVSFPDVPQPFEFDVRTVDGGVEWVTGGFPPWWAGTTVALTAGPNPDGPGARLHFAHGGFEPDHPIVAIITPAWAQILLRLKSFAETGQPQPFFQV